MSEKRFTIKSTATELELYDNGVKIGEFPHYEWVARPVDYVVKTLNEQQAIIRRDETSIKTMMSNMKKLEEENEQLRKELNDFKPVMFQDIRGTVILYSKGGIDE